MVQLKQYHFRPTVLIPNSPYPVLHYPALLPAAAVDEEGHEQPIATRFHDLLARHGWQAQWIFRYGTSQRSHYHSGVHETMVVLTGTATVRFGVADTTGDMHENTHENGRERGGVEVLARAGDVFVIPAGVAHKTFNPDPPAEFKLLTPGDGHGLPSGAAGKLGEIELDGFTMLGAYPVDGGSWDFAEGGEGADVFERAWAVPPPKMDPVLGDSKEGLRGLWRQ